MVGIRARRGAAHRDAARVLIGLRAITLVLIVICLLRPVTFVQVAGARDSVVAILVDSSRSMRIADADGPRIERARALASDLQKSIGAEFRTEVMTFGESLARADVDRITPDARRSDLSGALTALADRYKGQRLGGVVLLSDGGDTSASEAGTSRVLDVPVFGVGIGSPAVSQDREVVNMTAGEPVAAESSIDLERRGDERGFRHDAGAELRLSENGRPIETRQVTPSAPTARRFTKCSPCRRLPTRRRSTRSRFPSRLVSWSPRTTSAACSCRRRAAAGACSSSKARPVSNIRS